MVWPASASMPSPRCWADNVPRYGRSVIRAARPDDYARLQEIEREAGELFREIGMPEIAEHPPGDIHDFAAAEALLVAELDDRIVGYAWIELVDSATYLEQLSVVPAAGRQGIGTALLDAVADWARARGDRSVTLTTFRDVPFNGPLYERRGFVHVPEAEWTDDLHSVIDHQAAMGMDRANRTVMRRTLG